MGSTRTDHEGFGRTVAMRVKPSIRVLMEEPQNIIVEIDDGDPLLWTIPIVTLEDVNATPKDVSERDISMNMNNKVSAWQVDQN
jgi:hypothetical protein